MTSRYQVECDDFCKGDGKDRNTNFDFHDLTACEVDEALACGNTG